MKKKESDSSSCEHSEPSPQDLVPHVLGLPLPLVQAWCCCVASLLTCVLALLWRRELQAAYVRRLAPEAENLPATIGALEMRMEAIWVVWIALLSASVFSFWLWDKLRPGWRAAVRNAATVLGIHVFGLSVFTMVNLALWELAKLPP